MPIPAPPPGFVLDSGADRPVAPPGYLIDSGEPPPPRFPDNWDNPQTVMTREEAEARMADIIAREGVWVDPESPEGRQYLPATGPGQFARTVLNNFTLGWGDEIVGALGGDAEFERRRLAEHQAADPSGAGAAAFLGGALPSLLPAGLAVRGATTGARVGLGALGGGTAGAIYGAGAAEPGQRIEGAIRSGVPTAVVGGALPLVAPGIARALLPAGRLADDVVPPVNARGVTYTADEAIPGPIPPAIRRGDVPVPATAAARAGDASATGQPLLPTRDELRVESQAAFDRAEATGFQVAPTPFQEFADRLAQSLDGQIIERMHPNSVGALEAIEELIASGQPLTLRRLLNLREVLGDAAGSQALGDRRIGTIIKNQFDDFLDGLTAEQVSMPNWWDVDTAISSLDEGRALWGRMRKVETIETLTELAEDAVGANYTQAGFETAIRQQFRGLLRTLRRDSRQRALWTDEEFNLIETIVRGDSGWQNALRRLGSFAPRGAISTGFGIVGATTGNVPMMAASAAGEAARRISTGITNRNVSSLDAMVRTGGAAPSAPGANTSLPLFLLQQANVLGTPRLSEKIRLPAPFGFPAP